MSIWPEIPLSDTLEALIDYRGKSPPKSETGVPVISAKVVKDGRVLDHIEQTISPDYYETWMRRGLPKIGDVVMTTEGPLGEVARLDSKTSEYALGQRIVTMRGKAGLLDNGFLKYLLLSPVMQDRLESRATGTTVLGISQKALRDVLIPIAPIPEQREIAAILGSLDDKIELNRKTAATLEAMARALYRSWFVDFDPVHAKAAGRAPAHMDEATAALFPDSFGHDGLPEGWELTELGRICSQGKQTVKPMQQADQLFQHFSLPAFDTGQEAPFELGSEIKSNKLFVPQDAILFSRLNPRIPRVWWARTSNIRATPVCSTEFFVAEAATKEAVPYLFCLLSSEAFIETALSRVGGTSGSHQRVSPDSLKGIPVVSPASKVINAFGFVSQAWFSKIQLFIKENQTLATLRDTLLPRLMSGELRVGEAREQVEDVA